MSSPRPWRWQRQILRAVLPDGRRIADELEELFLRRLQLQHRLWVHGWHTRQVIGLMLRAPILWHAERAAQRAVHARGDGMMRTVLRDIRYAGRGLLRTPGQTAAAIITLGLGIGITTTEFGMFYGIFYRALPFEDADQLVSVWRTTPVSDRIRVPVHDFVEWREAQGSFTDLAADYTGLVGLRGSEESTQLDAAFVSWNALQILGTQPSLGRNFLEGDDQSGAPLVAIVSHRVWEERLGGDAGIVGQEAIINGEPATIIGVMPDGFHFPMSQDIWIPLRLDATQLEWGQGPALEVFGRLRDGVTLELANAEMAGITRRIMSDHPEADEGMEVSVRSYVALDPRVLLINWMIMVSALGVLLIACVNVANLLLARSAVRTREIALRTAMGARRLQIMMLMLAESSILASLGALVGIGIASVGLVGVRDAMAVVGDMPYWVEFKLDQPVLLFTAGAAALTGIVAGMIPAIRATTGNLTDFLKDGSRSVTGLKIGRLSRSLVAVAVAFATCLLIVAGLTTKAMAKLTSFDLPFDEQEVFTAGIDLFDSADSDDERRLLLDEVLGRLDEVAGVQTGVLTSSLPGLAVPQTAVGIEGLVYVTEQDYPVVHSMAVSPGFFDFLGVEPVRGRVFSSLDRAGEQPVAVVNESFARAHFPDRDPIGRQLRSGRANSTTEWRTIVGVVPDLLMQGMFRLNSSSASGFYVPVAQADNPSVSLLIRSQGAPLELTDGVRGLVSSIDPDLSIYAVRTLTAAIRTETWYLQMLGGVYIILGGAALFLASVGLFAVVSFGAERRTQEIGVRMAVGARARDVVRLIVGQGVTQIAVGLVVGIAMAVGLARVMAIVLFQTEPGDPAVYSAIIALILVVGVLALLIPALRAARLDPLRALQSR